MAAASLAADGRGRLMGTSSTQSVEDFQDLTIHDDFDPFDLTELPEEQVDAQLTAPPENQWYHGCLDRQTAETRLQQQSKPGSYLIRESERKPGSYVLSYLGNKGLNHFRITAMCGDFYVGGRQFTSLAELIGYYTHVSNILKNERLQFPVVPPEPVDDKKKVSAILPYTKVPETDELSFLAGDMFIVHNELGDGWLWVTSIRTGESGIVVEDLVKSVEPGVDHNEGKLWYHGTISKDEAANMLLKEGNIGSFVIRNSDKNPGDYSLSFRGPDTIQRFRIQKQGDQYVMGGRYYNSLDAIIDHYRMEEIVDGYKLGSAIAPKRYNTVNSSTSSDSISYDEIRRRRSSGLLIMGGAREDIIKQGFLSKKSQKHKKWKSYFFVLNSTEQHLYYFDSEKVSKRAKPKGLIDLGYASVYTVHESLFNRPNCFQIVVRAMNDVVVFYLNGETQELAQEWIQVLRSTCSRAGWSTTSRSNKRGVKQLKSLSLHVLEAHKIPPKYVPLPYCVISLNDIKIARTPLEQGPDPVWNEQFLFDDFPDEIDSFTIDVCNGAKRAKTTPTCRTTTLLEVLPNGHVVDDWYPLIAVGAQGRGEMGSLRVRAQFLQETLMPVEEYKALKDLILQDNEFHIIYALEEACAKDRSQLASVLLDIFRHQRKELVLLESLNKKEIQKEEERSTLFRSNSLATTLMDKYMKLTAQVFVQGAIRDVMVKIMETRHSCELNPLKLDKGADASVNLQHLLGFLTEISESIFNSAPFCPVQLRYLCHCLTRDVKEKWSEDNIIAARAVGGFIFLRLLCPAILNPRLFNIVQEAPPATASRTLMIVAKAIQNLANQVEFGANYKESFMEALNPFIVINKGRMGHFLMELSNVETCAQPSETPSIDLSRNLAALHQLCVTHIKELQKLSVVQPGLKKLLAVTEMLTQNKNKYMGGRASTLV